MHNALIFRDIVDLFFKGPHFPVNVTRRISAYVVDPEESIVIVNAYYFLNTGCRIMTNRQDKERKSEKSSLLSDFENESVFSVLGRGCVVSFTLYNCSKYQWFEFWSYETETSIDRHTLLNISERSMVSVNKHKGKTRQFSVYTPNL